MVKKKCKSVLLAIIAMTVLFSGVAQAEIYETIQTATFTASPVANIEMQGIDVMKISSTVPDLTSTSYLKTLPAAKGWLWRMITDPGSTAPTDNYDIYLVDVLTGADILNGAGLNRDTATSESAFPTQGAGQWEPVYFSGPTYFSVMGNSQAGAVLDTYLYILREKP